ncbi:uncharacterized protein LOC110944157 [Helianthus annuus]|uniref:uncharacterized protein LOC110944157 n=1 Tax=Helianthus annuus TaxID=4232 RepID=UPI000B8F250E|nr:uncharacterized protein LOC110944157 [Helianthus annuus]
MGDSFQLKGINLNQYLIVVNGVWRWRTSSDEFFSVKQVRKDLEDAKWADVPDDPELVWNGWATPKGNLLLWRALIGRIASREGLVRRGVPVADVGCPRCGLEPESPNHIFCTCLWAKCIWWNVLAWTRIRFPAECSTLVDLVRVIKESPGSPIWKRLVYTIVIATVWRIWSARNAKVFEGTFIPVMKSVELIKEDSFLWFCNRAKIKNPSWDKWVVFDVLDIL